MKRIFCIALVAGASCFAYARDLPVVGNLPVVDSLPSIVSGTPLPGVFTGNLARPLDSLLSTLGSSLGAEPAAPALPLPQPLIDSQASAVGPCAAGETPAAFFISQVQCVALPKNSQMNGTFLKRDPW